MLSGSKGSVLPGGVRFGRVVFAETVTGAVALHRFAGMIESQYGKQVELRIDTDLLPFRNEMVEEILRSITVKEPVLR